MNGEAPLYGLLAEFDSPEALVDATNRAYDEGFRHMDAYTPFPVHGLPEALRFHYTRLPVVVLIGGIVGGCAGYFLQYWISVIAYPLNVGGRPLHSWPSFIPVTFELIVLIAALSAVLGMLGLNGLPRPHHPLFEVPEFSRATRDGFFLCIEAADSKFSPDDTRQFLMGTGAREVYDVPAQ